MAQGRKTGGRKKGTPNKVTAAAKAKFLATFARLEGDLEGWIRSTAEGVEVPLILKDGSQAVGVDGKPVTLREGADPKGAAELLIKLAPYHFPMLGRQEVVGNEGGPLVVKVVTYGDGDA